MNRPTRLRSRIILLIPEVLFDLQETSDSSAVRIKRTFEALNTLLCDPIMNKKIIMPWRTLASGTLKGLSDEKLGTTLTPMPRFFMTGDGHRQPPFGWTNACKQLRAHFMTLIASKMLCAHVEEHAEQVEGTSVPNWLAVLYDQRRIFGWELTIYRDLRCGASHAWRKSKILATLYT